MTRSQRLSTTNFAGELFSSQLQTCATPTRDLRHHLTISQQQQVLHMAPGRQATFSSGRWCASQCLRQIGITTDQIGIGPSHEPLWPANVTGSISHTDVWAWAAVATSDEIGAVGIDVEQIRPFDTAILELIFTSNERRWLANVPAKQRTLFCTALFSAKESLYKALFPAHQQFIEFHEAEFAIDPNARQTLLVNCSAQLQQQIHDGQLHSHFREFDGHLWNKLLIE